MKNMKSLIALFVVILSTSACSKGGGYASDEANDPNNFISIAAQKMRNVDNCTKDDECRRAIAPIQQRRPN